MTSSKRLAILGLSALLILPRVFAAAKTVESKIPETKVDFKSTCFSDVCLGDDISKLTQGKHAWLTNHINTHGNDKNTVQLRELSEFRKKYAEVIGKSYHGLSAQDLEKLAKNFLDDGYSADPTYYGPLLESLARDRVSFLVADANVLSILEKAAVCGALPVHGVFVSESGLYTGILMMPVNGRLAVVQMKRLFNLHIPDDVTEAQRGRATFDQVTALVKQIDAKYGTQWDTSASGSISGQTKAVSDSVVAYLLLDDPSRGYRVEPMMTLSSRDFDGLPLQTTKRYADESLAATQSCEVKAKAVTIE